MGRETIVYKDKNYNRYPESKRPQLRNYYYRHDKWKESPVALHRQIYEDNHGPIPKGHQVHHKDNDFSNNSPDNLVCLTVAEHRKLHPMSDEAKAKRAIESRERNPLGAWRKENPDLAYQTQIENGKKGAAAMAEKAKRNRVQSDGGRLP